MKTNRTLKLITLTAAIFGFAATSFGQNPEANASANATATIIKPISIAKVSGADLLFGNIIADADGGTVTINTNGVREASGVAFPSVLGTVAAAEFTVTGFEGATYAITLPTEPVTITNGSSNQMTVTAFVENATKTLTGGTETFNVGATLNVGANQAEGEYSGSFSVIVAYN